MTVHSVEMRGVAIPASLQDAMSREEQARIILGAAEAEERRAQGRLRVVEE